MTENEIINRLHLHGETMTQDEAFFIMDALEEIQQYRAIGTVEEIENSFKKTINAFEKANPLIKSALDILQEYQSIGTIEDFKALKEKNTPKRRGIWKSGHNCCPNCKRGVVTEDKFCCYCGQALKPKET